MTAFPRSVSTIATAASKPCAATDVDRLLHLVELGPPRTSAASSAPSSAPVVARQLGEGVDLAADAVLRSVYGSRYESTPVRTDPPLAGLGILQRALDGGHSRQDRRRCG